MSYTADEMMTIAAARALRNGMTCFVGIGLPAPRRTWRGPRTPRIWC
jgi:acyl CoA:acetate/3-ketoacid CoA transferase beta subunit